MPYLCLLCLPTYPPAIAIVYWYYLLSLVSCLSCLDSFFAIPPHSHIFPAFTHYHHLRSTLTLIYTLSCFHSMYMLCFASFCSLENKSNKSLIVSLPLLGLPFSLFSLTDGCWNPTSYVECCYHVRLFLRLSHTTHSSTDSSLLHVLSFFLSSGSLIISDQRQTNTINNPSYFKSVHTSFSFTIISLTTIQHPTSNLSQIPIQLSTCRNRCCISDSNVVFLLLEGLTGLAKEAVIPLSGRG